MKRRGSGGQSRSGGRGFMAHPGTITYKTACNCAKDYPSWFDGWFEREGKAIHRRLFPGKYICRKCKTPRLPTAFLTQKGKMGEVCKFCKQQINDRQGSQRRNAACVK
jgi:hypothetical protein